MPRAIVIQAARDLVDDIAYHAMTVTHAAFDLACVLALGLLVYASGIDSAADPRPMADVQAHANDEAVPTCQMETDISALPQGDCITAVVLSALDA
jgi:hypothetical protein